jgi:hypothetical protein
VDEGAAPQQPGDNGVGGSQAMMLILMITGTMLAVCAAWTLARRTNR